MPGPISGVGQHVPAYCGACLKGRRLVTSLGPILRSGLAVNVEVSIFLSHTFSVKSIAFLTFESFGSVIQQSIIQ